MFAAVTASGRMASASWWLRLVFLQEHRVRTVETRVFAGQLLHSGSIAIKGVIHIRPRILAVCGMQNAEYPERRGTGSLTVAAPSPYSVFLSRDR